jgi:hypothetical protein
LLRNGQVAAAEAAAEGCDASSDNIPAAVSQQAGALFGVLETFLRVNSISTFTEDGIAGRIAACCCKGPTGRPNLLLQLAQVGTGPQQVAFFNLLVTLLKLSATAAAKAMTSAGCDEMVSMGLRCRCTTAKAAIEMLCSALTDNQAMSAAGTSSAASSHSGGTGDSSNERSAALWLLLLGRCCLQWGGELAQLQAEGIDLVQLIRRAQQVALHLAKDGHTIPETSLFICFTGSCPQLLSIAGDAIESLQGVCSSSSAGQLAAAGYDLGPVLQGIEALAACYPGVVQAEEPGDVFAGRVAGLIKALEAVGRACSVFAVPHCCNNPSCSNLAGPTEVSIVSGKGCICGGCQVARYCWKGCQQPHWKQHKPVCKMLQAAGVQHR